jgi:hypothetical protein
VDEKELAEYVIKKILDGMVFFIAAEGLIDVFEDGSPSRFERTGMEVKLRGFDGMHKLYFIKNDNHFKNHARSIVLGAGANFETLMGIIFEHSKSAHCHVYFIGSRFDLDKLSDMVYTLFTESGENKIKETSRREVYFAKKIKH